MTVVQGVEALRDVGVNRPVQVLHRGRQRLERGAHRLGEGLHLLQGPLGLAPDDPGDGPVDDFAAGKPGLGGDPARLQWQRLAGGVDRGLQIGQRPWLPPLVEDPMEMGRHLLFEPGRVGAGPPAGFNPGAQLGHQVVDVGRGLIGLHHEGDRTESVT